MEVAFQQAVLLWKVSADDADGADSAGRSAIAKGTATPTT